MSDDTATTDDSKLFSRAAAPTGVITLPQPLTDAEVAKLRNAFMQKHNQAQSTTIGMSYLHRRWRSLMLIIGTVVILTIAGATLPWWVWAALGVLTAALVPDSEIR